MTEREIKRMEKTLPRWENGRPPVRMPEQVRLAEELACRGMIKSILIYHGVENVQVGSYFHNQYLKDYERKLGVDTVARLCEEQIEDFRKAVVSFAGYDGEGVSYNSIVWADEMVDSAMELLEHDLAAEGPENGTGYTLPDGKYHIFAYVDFIDDVRVIVLEPNKVVDGAHEPIFGDTFIVEFGDTESLLKGLDWCFSEFGRDRYGIDDVLYDAVARAEKSVGCGNVKEIDKDSFSV